MTPLSDRGQKSESGYTTSRSLIVRLQHDEAPAWQDVIHLYAPLVFHWCRRAGLPDQECPDVVQEVFRSAYTGINGFRQDVKGGTFRGWLRTIARNKVIDFFRRDDKQPAAMGGSVAENQFANIADVDDEPAEDDQDLRAEHALYLRAFELIQNDLKPNTWQAFYRVVVEGKDAATVAAELGMLPGAVRVAKSRVLKRLREQLGDLLD